MTLSGDSQEHKFVVLSRESEYRCSCCFLHLFSNAGNEHVACLART